MSPAPTRKLALGDIVVLPDTGLGEVFRVTELDPVAQRVRGLTGDNRPVEALFLELRFATAVEINEWTRDRERYERSLTVGNPTAMRSHPEREEPMFENLRSHANAANPEEIRLVDFSQAPAWATSYTALSAPSSLEGGAHIVGTWRGDEPEQYGPAPVFFTPRGHGVTTVVYRTDADRIAELDRLERQLTDTREATQAEADAIVDEALSKAGDGPSSEERAAFDEQRRNYLDGFPRDHVREPEQQRRATDKPRLEADEPRAEGLKGVDTTYDPKQFDRVPREQLRPGENPMVGKVTGYRKLTNAELDLVNAIKAKGEELAALHAAVCALLRARDEEPKAEDAMPLNAWAESGRWAAIGKTDLQTGLMALIRAVAAPGGF